MTDEPYPPLRPQHPVPVRRRPTPWPMIIGLVVLAALATILAIIVLGGDGTATDPSSSASPSATVSASASPVASASASASAPAASPSGSAPVPSSAAIAMDSIVATVVDRLSVRSAPSTAAERLGSLEAGALSFVAAGPTDADGFRWYLVSTLGLPPNTGCAVEFETDPYNCPDWFGWVAGGLAGEGWLTPHELECPSAPLTAETLILARTNVERLACFGAEPITFRGFWPTIPDDAGLGGACPAQDEPSGWLLCQNINDNHLTIDEDEGFGGVGARVSIDPASGLTMPERGTWVEVRVHLDDPAAQGCDEAASDFAVEGDTPERYVLDCRAEMVLEAVQAVDGP